jgi:hypothetical protein
VRPVPFAAVLAAGSFLVAFAGCAHLQYGSTPYVSPTPTGSVSPTQAPCIQTATANAQIVAMSPLITPTIDPTYGLINGYGLVTNGGSNNVAAPIVVKPTDVVQFFNNDQGSSQLRYSAVGIPSVTAFPGPTYTFPPSAVTQFGTQINGTQYWSTGLLAGQCYSQAFTISAPGTYYFGDYTYYGLGNVRDVIVATTTAPQ